MNPADGCETNVAADADNCGACGMKCPVPANATAGCKTGMCGIGMCNANFADCDMNPANGCETNTATDANNCGGCKKACNFANGMGACLAGQCGLSMCNQGFTMCGQNPNATCVNLQSDAMNCGKCGNVCPVNLPACVFGACSAMCKLNFAPMATYATGAGPQVLSARDFNGDGKLDLAVADYGDQSVGVLLNQGPGTFAAKADYPVGGLPRGLAAGDFNGDGKPDIATTNIPVNGNGGNSVSVLLNLGAGTFGAKVDYAVGANPQSVAVGDLNGDGKRQQQHRRFPQSVHVSAPDRLVGALNRLVGASDRLVGASDRLAAGQARVSVNPPAPGGRSRSWSARARDRDRASIDR